MWWKLHEKIVRVDWFQCLIYSSNYENKLVEDLIQPGGMRVKPTESALQGFCTACENFPPKIIGSLLLNKFNEEVHWISKAVVYSHYFSYFY